MKAWMLPGESRLRFDSGMMVAVESTVAKAFGCVPAELMKRTRPARLAWTRQVVMYFLRKLGGMTWEETAGIYHLDHATAMHAYKIVEHRMACYPKVKAAIEGIEKQIKAINDRGDE